MATKKKTARPLSSFADLDDAGIGIGYRRPSVLDDVPAIPEPPKERGTVRAVGDMALALGQGVTGSVKSLTDLAGADNAVSRGLDSASKGMEGWKSEQSQALRKKHQAAIKAAEDSGDTAAEIGAYANMLWDMPAESLASGIGSFATLGLGKAAQALKLAQAARAAGVSKEVFLATEAGAKALNAAREVGFKTNMGVGMLQGAGAVKGSQYEQTYNNAIAQGMAPEQAEQLATEAQSYAKGGMQQALGAGLGLVAAKTGPVEKLIAGKGAGAGGLMQRTAAGFGTEALTEGTQGGQERYAGNTAAIDAGVLDPSKRFTGVAGQGVSEGLVGGVLGGGAGALGGADVAPAAGLPAVTTGDQIRAIETVPEAGPMTRAANLATEQKARAADALGATLTGTDPASPVQGAADPLMDALRAPVDQPAAPVAEQPAIDPFEAPAAVQPPQPDARTPRDVPDAFATPPDLSTRTDDELRMNLRNAQDQGIRSQVAAELARRRAEAPQVEQPGGVQLVEDAAQAPNEGGGLILAPSGKPFATKRPAMIAAKKTPGEVVAVPGGFAVRLQQEAPHEQAATDAAGFTAPDETAAPAVAAQPGAAEGLAQPEPGVQAEQPEQTGALSGAADAQAQAPSMFDATAGEVLDREGETQKAAEPTQEASQPDVAGPQIEQDAIDVQNATQPAAIQGEVAKTPGDEAPAPAGGDAAAASGVPAEAGAGDVQADGVAEWNPEQAKMAMERDEFVDAAVERLKAKREKEGRKAFTGIMGDTELAFRQKSGIAWDDARKTADASKNTPAIDTSAEPVQEAAKTEQVKKAPFAKKEDLDHLFGIDQKRQRAVERVDKGTAYFATQEKANDFIKTGAIKDTHEVVQTKNGRFEVKAKAVPADAAVQQPSGKLPPTQIRVGDVLMHEGQPFTVKQGVDGGVAAESQAEDLGSGVTQATTRIFLGDEAIRAKLEADSKGYNGTAPAEMTADEAPAHAARWDSLDAERRMEVAKLAGWSTTKNTPNPQARQIAKKAWADLAPSTRKRIHDAIGPVDAAPVSQLKLETPPEASTGAAPASQPETAMADAGTSASAPGDLAAVEQQLKQAPMPVAELTAEPQAPAPAPNPAAARPAAGSAADSAPGADEQARQAVGQAIDSMDAQQLQKVAASFLPTVGQKVPMGKARVKAAMTAPGVSPQAAAEALGVKLPESAPTAVEPDTEPAMQSPEARGEPATAQADPAPADAQAAGSAEVVSAAPAKKPRAASKKATERAQQLADYFAPGNILSGYGGTDEVLSYTPSEDGGFSVRVHEVRKIDGEWVRVGKPQNARVHSTRPEPRQLAAGPLERLGHQPADEVKYTDARPDGQPFPNAVERGLAPTSPQDFIPAPGGGLDYGEITPEMSKAMRRQAGKIRLRQGNEAWGLTHIEARHGAQFKSLGFQSASDYIAHVASSFNAIYKGRGAGLSIVLETGRTGGRLMVQLEPSDDGDFYDVKTASPIRAGQYKNEKPLWQRAGTSAPTAQDSSLLPGDQSGQSSVPPATPDAQATDDAGKPAKIEDSGEVLEGARKLYAKNYAAKLDEGTGMDTAGVPLSKSWPEPDYQRLIDEGADPWAVALARAVRDEIPTKPAKAWKLKGWVAKVEGLRDMAQRVMNGSLTKERFLAEAGKYRLDDWLNKIDLYEAVGHANSLKGLKLSQHEYGVYGGQVFKPAKKLWTVNAPSTSASATWSNGSWGNDLVVADTKEEAIEKFKVWAAEQAGKDKPAAKGVEFDVYRYRNRPRVWIVGKRISATKSIDLMEFETSKEAQQYAAKNQAELERLLADAKAEQAERREENAPRIGEDHRNGADVTTEQFRETFGFRGEQFGASMPQAERQSNLNQAYDALMDLAGVLGVPPRALSLNGELGLAFGARGTGGKRAASAHYEPDTTGTVTPNRVVINLTRKNGAGSLAHEWFHAVDNYFARMRGEKAGMLTESYAAKREGVRPEMVDAFKRVVMAIQSTGVRERSKNMDKKRTKDYWSTGVEMAARSFESYVIAKLQDKSGANDYLANILPESAWLREDSYPYPTMGELPAIRAAFDHFFDTVQTRHDDAGNVAMFSRSPMKSVQANTRRGLESLAKALDERTTVHRAMFRNGLGWVDFVWGSTGSIKPSGKTKGAMGISHIIEARQRKDGLSDGEVLSLLNGIVDAIASGAETRRNEVAGSVTVVVEKNGIEAILTRRSGSNAWLVSGWNQKNPDASAAGSVAGTATSSTPTTAQRGDVAGFGEIVRSAGSDVNMSRGQSATGLPQSQVQSIADGIKARWANAPGIEVVSDMQDSAIPERVRDADAELRSQGASGEPEGFFYKGKVYIVAGALKEPGDVERVLFHEALGHYGLRGVFGDRLTPILKQLAALRRSEVAAKAKEYGLDMANESDRLQAAEEVLAVMAQKHPELGYVKRAIAAVRAWLRKHVPGFQGMRLTDDEITQRYILPARRFVEGGPGGGPRGGLPAFLRAFHGSPHRFDKFSTDKIGTGEGAQAYGWGLYFASKREVAEHYREMLKGRARIEQVDRNSYRVTDPDGKAIADGLLLGQAHKVKDEYDDKAGQVFEVEIPEDSEMLLWDRPLSEQPEAVRTALAKVNPALFTPSWTDAGVALAPDMQSMANANTERATAAGFVLADPSQTMTGEQFYRQLASQGFGDNSFRNGGSRAASEALAAAGIKGIKYLDGTSRADGDGSYNYVIFDGADTEIVQTYFSRATDQASTPIGNAKTVTVDGKERPALNSNGQAIHPTVEGVRNFWRWFADSRAVDAEGRPLVVYHGTAEDFDAFDKAKSGGNWRQGEGAFFFTIRQRTASNYATRGGEGANVMPVYLSLKSPYTRTALDPIDFYDNSVKPERESLEAQGFDGVLVKSADGGADLFVAFRPEQIKSATGNNGDFDGDNPDIRFSRTLSDNQVAGQVREFDVAGKTGNALAHYRGMALQALGRRQLVDLYQQYLPQLTEYDRLVQNMEAEKNDTGAEADGLAREWGSLDGDTKRKGEELKLAELMHDATLAKIDPQKDHQAGDDRAQWAGLRAKFNALDPKSQALYVKARDMYADHYAKVRKAIAERIERSDMSDSQKKQTMARMDDDFFKKTKGVYFPLARFGSYVMVVKDKNGEVVNVSRAETLNEAETTRKQLQQVFPRDGGFNVSKVLKDAEFNPGRDAVGKGFMADLLNVLDKQGVDEALRDSVSQLYLASLPDLSWAKHGIHRKGTPGFSQDARRAFAQNMFHGARHLAKLRYADRLQGQLEAMDEHIKAYREIEEYDSVKAQQVLDEMVERHESLMNPKTNPLSTALTSIGFVFCLGISPAAAMVNLSQTALVAYPVMGAKWGYAKAGAALIRASKETVAAKNDISKVLQGDELAAYEQAVSDGTIDVTMAHDLAGISQGEDAKVTWAMRPVMRAASFLFHHAERFNRQATFIASFRLAKEAGADNARAFEEAKKATYDGHFDYGAANRPRIMQGNVAKVVLLFKQYGQNMVYTLSRQAYLSMKGLTPADRAEARKQLSGILALHAAAAGALGLPIVGALLSAASFIGGDDDEPWDAEVALKNAMADAMGPKAAEVMAHGLSRLTPWDLSGRVALNKLILPDVREGLEGQDLAKEVMTAAAGPVGGIFVGMFKGLQSMSEGKYGRGLEEMLPVALRNPIKAMRFAEEGAVDKSGVVIKDEVSLAGVLGQASGFAPSEVRLATEGKSAIISHDRARMERRQALMAQFAQARMADDAEGMAEVRKDIERFNSKNPTRRITPLHLIQSMRARQRRIDGAEQGVYLPKNRRDAVEAGRFAVAD